MLVRVPRRASVAQVRRSAAPSRTARTQPQTRKLATAAATSNPFSPSTGTIQQIDDVVYGRLDELKTQLKDLKAKNQKVGIDKYNELLGANIFKGDVGGIVESVDAIVKDGVSPNNTTVRLLNYFFGKTDNFVKGEALIEKIEDLHNVPKKASTDLAAALPQRKTKGGYAVRPRRAKKFGQLLSVTDANASELTSLFGAWHAAKNAKGNDAAKKSYNALIKASLKKAVSSGLGQQLAAKLGVPLVPKGSLVPGKAAGKKVFKDAKLAARYKKRFAIVKAKLRRTRKSISAVSKYLASQPFNAGTVQVNFADLVSVQRVFQNTHGELKKYISGVRAIALANLILQGAPALPSGQHPFTGLYLSKKISPKDYKRVAAETKGDKSVKFVPAQLSANNVTKPVLENHERFFADYYTSNDDLKAY